jgi:hypothetical protein
MFQLAALHDGRAADAQGRAVQVDPIKPTLKGPGIKRLKVKCDKSAFQFCFQSQLAPLHQGADSHDHNGGGLPAAA